jgi:hypothetical protein
VVKLVRPTKEIFAAQLELVANYAELRESRASEILAQAMPTQSAVLGFHHRHAALQAALDPDAGGHGACR